MEETIKELDDLEKIKNCKSIIVTLQRGSFKGEKINQILFKRQNFEYIIAKNMKYIEINTERLKEGTELLEEFLNFFELIFIFYGYFPKISKIEFESNNGIFLSINKEKYLVSKYVTFKEHKKDYNKLIDINTTIDNLSEILDKWIKLKELLGVCISGMLLSQSNAIPYCDVITVTLLQSCEGYITNYILSDLGKYNSIKVKINKGKKDISYKLIENCENKDKKYIEIFFYDKLKIFIQDFGEQVLKQEYKNQYDENNRNEIFDTLNIFLDKCKNSRNRLSHMNEKGKKCFEGFENLYALFKLLLIFRLNLIVDLGLKNNIMKDNIDKNILCTELWYHQLCKKFNKKGE